MTETTRTSIRAHLFNLALRLSGIKRILSLPDDKLEAKIRKLNAKRGFKIPNDCRAFYRDEVFFDRYHCLVVSPHETSSERAILLFFGGGMLLNSDDRDVNLVVEIAHKTGCDVWFPYYPLCLDHSIHETYEMCFECYKQMLILYGAGNVSTCGWSSGGALAIGVALHNNATHAGLDQPRHIVAVSPGECPWNEGEHARMHALDCTDREISYEFMKRVEKYMRHGEKDIPDYMISGSRGDFSGIREIHFYYSDDEVLYGARHCFEQACDKYGVNAHFDVQSGVFHCYCMLPFTPEGTKKLGEIIEILKS